MIDIHEPVVITDGGPWAEHDHACSVCRTKPSVLNLDTGIFQPCWECQDKGWKIKKSGWFK